MCQFFTLAKRLPFWCLMCLWLSSQMCHAQDAPSAKSPDQIAAEIIKIHPKILVLVFDVSESTKSNGVFRQERDASATLIRQGTSPGDRVVLETFGTGYQTLFDKTLTSSADADGLVEQLPSDIQVGHGTNIRWPHAEALSLIQKELPKPGVIVLLTDSFNDRPLTSDPAYGKYLDYYTLKGLTIYPSSPENREYERLLSTLKASGKLTQYGIGVGIAPTGRPIERLPVGPGQGDAAVDSGPTTTTLAPIGHEKPQSILPEIIGAVVVILLLIVGAVYALLSRPLSIRLTLGEKGTPRDYVLRPGTKVGLGGTMTSVAAGDDVFPLAGLAVPAAWVLAGRGSATLTPGPAFESLPGLKVFHSGVVLEQSAPLRIGDEIRLVLPATDAAPSREYRVRFADPKAAAF